MENNQQRGSAVAGSEGFSGFKSTERACRNGGYCETRKIEGKLLCIKI